MAEYNSAIVNLRAHEYVNRETIRRYWSDQTARQFDDFMAEVRRVDNVAHAVNDPLIRFISDRAKPTVLTDAKIKTVAGQMAAPLSQLCRSGEALLFSLSGVGVPSDRKSCE
ncbi:MAG TPA: hypothetical protein VEK57_03510 [Thermoanaerobaculia bacterium]|nr:hypothetical protein [Thermoanaerobaculia bacterium]